MSSDTSSDLPTTGLIAASFAHELRSPISVALSFLEMTIGQLDQEKQTSLLCAKQEVSKILNDLIQLHHDLELILLCFRPRSDSEENPQRLGALMRTAREILSEDRVELQIDAPDNPSLFFSEIEMHCFRLAIGSIAARIPLRTESKHRTNISIKESRKDIHCLDIVISSQPLHDQSIADGMIDLLQQSAYAIGGSFDESNIEPDTRVARLSFVRPVLQDNQGTQD